MAKIHFILQGKGGAGKSLISTLIAQYKKSKGQKPLCIDTDPVNATFSGYKALGVKQLIIMENNEINPRGFDTLIEMIAKSKDDVVIDNGSSTFVPLTHFLISNQVPSLLVSMGHEIVVHTIIVGGAAMMDSLSGFSQLIAQFPPEAIFVVWINPHEGTVVYEGKTFEQTKAYNTNKERISAIIQLPTLKKETYGQDLADMQKERLTFEEALERPSNTIMVRQRLSQIRRELYDKFDNSKVM